MVWRSEVRDGMRIDWDVELLMDDHLTLKADVFRPTNEGSYPVVLSYGPYAKGLLFQDGYPDQWNRMVADFPEIVEGSTNQYQNWEVVDPEKWVPHGYVCVRVDSRGTGRSPGFVDPFSPRETKDMYDCIEWAGTQPWSNGRVGLNGISYYGINQWHVASLNPPHLAAMCVWEGAADWYRDMTHHGGILSTFWANWFDMQVKTVQYGLGENGARHPVTGLLVCGDETLTEEELKANRTDFGAAILSHPLDDQYHHDRSPVLENIDVPILSAGNWGGQGLHLRGNIEGFLNSASDQKWLEVHGIEHWTHFYTDYGRNLQIQFLDRFLKGQDNGWAEQPTVRLQVRHPGEGFVERFEDGWPIPRTLWKNLHLHPDLTLSDKPPTEATMIEFEALGEGLLFRSAPLERETEVTGPLAAKLTVSSSTEDADIFVVFRVFDPDGNEVTFQGALDPHTPIGQGWQRASHRALDENASETWRPVHSHQERQLLTPGQPVGLDIEIWPTSIVIPVGYTMGIAVRGKDYEYEGDLGETAGIASFKNRFTGCGPFLHNDPNDRPASVFGGTTTVHLGPDRPAYALAPVIPPKA